MDSATLRSPIESLNPSEPICMAPTTTVAEVIKTMKEHRFGCVFVVDDGQLAGIVTERDILKKVVGGDVDPTSLAAQDIMTTNPEYLFSDDEISFALNRMHVGGFRHIPLIQLDGRPTGVVSVRDILDHLVRSIGDEDTN